MCFAFQYTRHLFLAVLFLLYSAYATADETAAIAVVEELHSALIKAMQNADSLGYQGRYDILAPVIQSRFDTPLISKVILSRYWNEMNEEQQQHFIQLFSRLSIATYASRFDDYSGQSFRTTGAEPLKKERLLIRTELINPGDDNVQMDYLMQQNNGRWYIISVIANGINDLSLKRAEYAAIISNKGFDQLIAEIEKKIQELAGSPKKS
jgi:phospholipid transport system substrate-binding protein